MQAASQSETWGMEWQNLDVSLEEKELAFATFFVAVLKVLIGKPYQRPSNNLMLFTWK